MKLGCLMWFICTICQNNCSRTRIRTRTGRRMWPHQAETGAEKGCGYGCGGGSLSLSGGGGGLEVIGVWGDAFNYDQLADNRSPYNGRHNNVCTITKDAGKGGEVWHIIICHKDDKQMHARTQVPWLLETNYQQDTAFRAMGAPN